MRLLLLALLLSSAPGVALAHDSPRSLALELGYESDSSQLLGSRAPVALSATQWLLGDLDATVRIAWGFAARPGVRVADGSFEAGGGLRYSIATWGPLCPQLLADVAFVQVFGVPVSERWTSDSGVRLGAGAGMEIFLSRDVSLSLVARWTELVLTSGEGGPGFTVASGIGLYF